MKRQYASIVVAASVFFLAAASGLRAQAPDSEILQEIESLKRGQQQINQQLQEIKKLIQARPATPSGPSVKGKVFDIGNNPVKGASSAKLTLVEFTDYQ